MTLGNQSDIQLHSIAENIVIPLHIRYSGCVACIGSRSQFQVQKMMRMQLFFLSRVAILWVSLLLASCGANPDTQTPPVTQTVTIALKNEQATVTGTLLPTSQSTSRCELFTNADLSITLLDFYPTSSSLTLYAEFPGAVIGLEDDTDDGFPWQYTASLGSIQSIWCALFEGDEHIGRLYCRVPLPVEYRNTPQPFLLYVNLCQTPVLSIPALDLQTAADMAPGASSSQNAEVESNLNDDLNDQSLRICGTAPSSSCSLEFENWCGCMGGYYSCWEAYDFPKCDIP